MHHDYARELEIALAAVREAGRLSRAVQAGIDPGMQEKRDRSPVTVADYGSQALVCRALASAFPDDPVIGEEDSQALREGANAGLLERVLGHVQVLRPGATADAVLGWIDRGGAREASPRCWTLDPIDGTKGFLRGEQYAVALALLVDGEVVLSALCCPNLGPELGSGRGEGSVFAAVRGAGAAAYSMDPASSPRPITVSPEQDPTRIRFCESVEAAHSSHDDAVRIARHLGIVADSARLDSQTKYGVVARGEAEAYLRLPKNAEYREMIWDHAGGVLLVEEAGGRVTDIAGRPLDFSRGHRLEDNRGVIVTNGVLHEHVMGAIRELGIGV
jgi:3'(2'), 5'-bisphosphate nucleotidase